MHNKLPSYFFLERTRLVWCDICSLSRLVLKGQEDENCQVFSFWPAVRYKWLQNCQTVKEVKYTYSNGQNKVSGLNLTEPLLKVRFPPWSLQAEGAPDCQKTKLNGRLWASTKQTGSEWFFCWRLLRVHFAPSPLLSRVHFGSHFGRETSGLPHFKHGQENKRNQTPALINKTGDSKHLAV